MPQAGTAAATTGAVVGALWALAFLVDHGTAAYVVPPLVLAALLLLDRAPLPPGCASRR